MFILNKENGLMVTISDICQQHILNKPSRQYIFVGNQVGYYCKQQPITPATDQMTQGMKRNSIQW
jgi:hypothetical protein